MSLKEFINLEIAFVIDMRKTCSSVSVHSEGILHESMQLLQVSYFLTEDSKPNNN